MRMEEDANQNENSLTVLCQRLGAPEAQARTMARQLMKRSEQISRERGIKRVEALDHLLSLLISGSQGINPPEFPPRQG
ncbi:hypothetical protein [Cerasicoccus arenae]|uniref:Uncharacterized protein n=1 Tax=Cerasicoccus arenae TaxID=424488 RepID=A0A8J3DD59_9BACT|nr:hypothetical protein [Cerasicoccus arenae]MBK1859987.1 hypothetical protein [Cerasicoccus arenae]GHC12427.1 hypothetical protein GCM10007047_32290 [Cerasicoccus arenae]